MLLLFYCLNTRINSSALRAAVKVQQCCVLNSAVLGYSSVHQEETVYLKGKLEKIMLVTATQCSVTNSLALAKYFISANNWSKLKCSHLRQLARNYAYGMEIQVGLIHKTSKGFNRFCMKLNLCQNCLLHLVYADHLRSATGAKSLSLTVQCFVSQLSLFSLLCKL